MLLVGLLLALGPVLLVLPTSHEVTLSIASPRSLTRLEALWLEGSAGDAAARQIVWSFEPGSAPSQLRFELRAVRGRYRLQVDSERGDRRRTQVYPVELGLFSSTMTFHVR